MKKCSQIKISPLPRLNTATDFSVWQSESGQTLVEFALLSFTALLIFGSLGYFIYRDWRFSLCAHAVFDKTHQRLIGQFGTASLFPIEIRETDQDVTGIGMCGDWREKVRLPKLEVARW